MFDVVSALVIVPTYISNSGTSIAVKAGKVPNKVLKTPGPDVGAVEHSSTTRGAPWLFDSAPLP